MKLSKELDRRRIGLINIQNADDNERFKQCLVAYFNPADHNVRGITKTDKDFAKRLDFKDIEFTVETRDINKIEKKTIFALAFLAIKTK